MQIPDFLRTFVLLIHLLPRDALRKEASVLVTAQPETTPF